MKLTELFIGHNSLIIVKNVNGFYRKMELLCLCLPCLSVPLYAAMKFGAMTKASPLPEI